MKYSLSQQMKRLKHAAHEGMVRSLFPWAVKNMDRVRGVVAAAERDRRVAKDELFQDYAKHDVAKIRELQARTQAPRVNAEVIVNLFDSGRRE